MPRGAIYTCHVDDLTFYNSTRAALHVAPNSWADPIEEKYADNFPFLNSQNNTHIYIYKPFRLYSVLKLHASYHQAR